MFPGDFQWCYHVLKAPGQLAHESLKGKVTEETHMDPEQSLHTPPPHIKNKEKELHSEPQTDPDLKLPNNSNTCEQNLLTCSSILKLFMEKLTLS